MKWEEVSEGRGDGISKTRGLTVGLELQRTAEVPFARTIRRAEEQVFEEGDVGVDWAD